MYERGKVYAIICRKTGRKYIGSTCEPTIAKRLAKHVTDFKHWKEGKRSWCSSFDIIQDNDYHIVLLELYSCNSKDELRMCEQKHIDLNECGNKVKAFLSKEEKIKQQKEYIEKHKERIAERMKKWYENNKEQLLKYQKIYAS